MCVHSNRHVAVLQLSTQPVSILQTNGHCRNFGKRINVSRRTSMWIVVSTVRHASDNNTDRSVFSCSCRTSTTVLSSFSVSTKGLHIRRVKLIVIKNNFPTYLILFFFEVIVIFNFQYIRL